MIPLRTAIVGVGIAGQSHLLDAVTQKKLNIVAVVGRHRQSVETVAHRFDVPRAFINIDALLRAEQLDAIVIATPVQIMPFHVIQALRANLKVLAEKPLASTLEPLAIMQVLDGVAASPTLAIAYPRRYSNGWIRARQWISSGCIGTLRRLSVKFSAPYSARYGPAADTHRRDLGACVAGVLLDSGSHAFDAVQFLTGRLFPPQGVSFKLNEQGTDIAARVVLGGVGSPMVDIALDESVDEDQLITIEGDRGFITIRFHAASLEAATCSETVEAGYVARPVDDLIRMHEGKKPIGASLDDSRNVIQALTAVYRLGGRPLERIWLRPRAKAIARTSGAC